MKVLPILLRYAVLFCAALLRLQSAIGQSLPQVESARSAALSGSVVALSGTESLDINPAASQIDSVRTVRFYSGVSPFVAGLDQSLEFTASAEYYNGSSNTTSSLGFARYGYGSIFSYQTMLASFAKHFTLSGERTASVGIRGRYESIGFGGAYPALDAMQFDAGLQFAITNEVNFGAAAENLLGAHFTLLNGDQEELDRTFHAGFSYAPSPGSITLLAAIDASAGNLPMVHIGAEYVLEKVLALRVGATPSISLITAGVGIYYSKLQLDAAASYTPLGTSLSFEICLAW